MSVISTYCLVNFPNVGAYEPRIALYCREEFNDWIEDGKIWFQPSADDSKVTVHFDPDEQDVKFVKRRSKFDGVPIRRPDAPPDAGEAARSPVDAQAWLESWPPRRVFDLHRLVLAPYRRSEERKEKVVGRKRKTPPASTPSPVGVAASAASPPSPPPRLAGAPSCACKGKCATSACVCRSSNFKCNNDCHSGLAKELKDKAQKHKNCENHV